MPALSLDNLVNISVNINQDIFSSQSFSSGLCVFRADSAKAQAYAPSTPLFPDEIAREYKSFASVISDGWGKNEFQSDKKSNIGGESIANVWFSQKFQGNNPGSLCLGIWNNVPTSGYFIYKNNTQYPLASWQLITTGTIRIVVGGTSHDIGALDFSSATSFAQIAQIITQTLITANIPAYCYFYNNGQQYFYFKATDTGTTSSVSIASISVSDTRTNVVGKDITPYFGTLDRSFSGAAEVDIATFLTKIVNSSLDFYHLTFPTISIVTALQISLFTQVCEKKMLYWYDTCDITGAEGRQFTDVSASRTIVSYLSSGVGLLSVAASSLLSTVFATTTAMSLTLANRILFNVMPDKLTQNQADTLIASRVNYYTFFGNDAGISGLYKDGLCAFAQFADTIVNIDFIVDNIQSACANLLASSKISQTNSGVASIVSVIGSTINSTPTHKGMIALNSVWDGASLPISSSNPKIRSGEYFVHGYKIAWIPIEQQDPTNRKDRLAPPIYVALILTGAIHKINIAIDIQS